VLSENWRKSNRSNNNGACVEARIVDDVIQVRNSTDPAGPVVSFTRKEWTAFLGGAEDGDFNIA
jgi:hypothetical protein